MAVALLSGAVDALTFIGGLSLSYWQAVGWTLLGEPTADLFAGAVDRQ
ncbi:MAG: hypothetical protein ACRDHP_07670 [Ktedonobacterales bacterium]